MNNHILSHSLWCICLEINEISLYFGALLPPGKFILGRILAAQDLRRTQWSRFFLPLLLLLNLNVGLKDFLPQFVTNFFSIPKMSTRDWIFKIFL